MAFCRASEAVNSASATTRGEPSMQLRGVQSALSIGLLLGCFGSVALAQAPAGGGTLWHFLGIPQGIRYVRDNTLNRSGNRPGLERKPPLKPIGDPKNLESKDASIKK